MHVATFQSLIPPPSRPRSARHSTTTAVHRYLGDNGVLLGEPRSRAWVRRAVRQGLRVARSAAEIRRVMDVWRHVHYLGKGGGSVFPPKTIRLHYFLDLPCLRAAPEPWIPAACVTVRYCLPGGIPASLRLESPLQALEIARSFVADDLRYPRSLTYSPAILREVVTRLRQGTDWQRVVAGRVQWKPLWLLTYADPGVGHDGGVYRGRCGWADQRQTVAFSG